MKSLSRLEREALTGLKRFYGLRLKARTHPGCKSLLKVATNARNDAMEKLKALQSKEKSLGLA